MGIVETIKDFALFKEFVTPGFLKILYLVSFVLLNLGGIMLIAFLLITGLLGALATISQNATAAIISIVVALITAAVLIVMLVIYNLLLRMYFEIVLLMFNIHGFLKSIDQKTKK